MNMIDILDMNSDEDSEMMFGKQNRKQRFEKKSLLKTTNS